MITNPNVKINLGLNVLRKREDGFHDLETLFVPYFRIHDTLEIVVGDDYSRTSAALFAKYGSQVPASQGYVKPEGVFGVETLESDAPKIVQGISEDGKLMITIARDEGVDWDPLTDLCARAYLFCLRISNYPLSRYSLRRHLLSEPVLAVDLLMQLLL
jgi:4-diphosphocytidyl-2-C-methyl-D-erythritol kinase